MAVKPVARFTRAWIETNQMINIVPANDVARFTRAWIETGDRFVWIDTERRPLYAGVD